MVAIMAASAASYTVGDSTGWAVPDSPAFYTTWASSKTFRYLGLRSLCYTVLGSGNGWTDHPVRYLRIRPDLVTDDYGNGHPLQLPHKGSHRRISTTKGEKAGTYRT